MKNRFTFFKLFALIPIMGICLFLSHAHYQASTGLVYRVKIKGYDPRDLLHGHYLRYTFDFATESLAHKHIYLPKAKYCFIHLQTSEHRIEIMPYSDKLAKCSSVINYSKLSENYKYFIPEIYASDLEKKLRDRKIKATVDLIINQNNDFTVGQLYLNDQPWEDALIKEEQE